MSAPPPPAILVVDDDDLLRRAITKMVHRLGGATLECGSVAAALDVLASRRVDLVVCDLDLGDGSGLAIARYLGTQPSPAPVIVISGHPASIVHAQAHPGDPIAEVLEKPFTADDLGDAIARALHRT